jgi:hypothetical protein
MIHILAAFAEHEAKEISGRVKAALGAYRDNGHVSARIQAMYPDGVPADVVAETAGKLGASLPQCRNLTDEARLLGAAAGGKVELAKAVDAYADLTPRMLAWRAEGLSLAGIAQQLNGAGEETRNGGNWSATQVKRVLDRVG